MLQFERMLNTRQSTPGLQIPPGSLAVSPAGGVQLRDNPGPFPPLFPPGPASRGSPRARARSPRRRCRGAAGTAVVTQQWPCRNAESPPASPSVRRKAAFSPAGEGIFTCQRGHRR